MIAGLLELELFLPYSQSLKEKRQNVKSLVKKIQSKFHLATAEVEYQNLWQRSIVGISCVAKDVHQSREILSNVLRWSEAHWDGEIIRSHIHYFSTKEEN